MRKWRLPLTYGPKIQAVIDGACHQTIRTCSISKSKKTPGKVIRKEVGDLVRFYVWTGRPYWSHPKPITEYVPLTCVKPITIVRTGIYWNDVLDYKDRPIFNSWSHMDWLAALDHISPATGDELGRVLIDKNRIPAEGIEAQVLRWEP